MLDIPRQNLNLLVVLDALLSERSITRAAARLHMSQPAMSAAVAKLRQWLGDPLLVRGVGGYTLTTRAEELIDPLRLILEDIERTLQKPAVFDPASAQNTFRIAANDAFELVVLPPLMQHLQQVAPQVRIVVESTEGVVPVDALTRGAVDVAWGHFEEIPAGLRTEVMLEDTLACLVRKGHPSIQGTLSLMQFCTAPHLMVALKGNTLPELVQRRMAESGLTLNVALQVAHMLAAPVIVMKSDYLLTLPTRVARSYAELLGLEFLPLPFDYPPIALSLVWHERVHRDAGTTWLRRTIQSVCETL
jgi:DNA-binding transcriptional LysR family regulator